MERKVVAPIWLVIPVVLVASAVVSVALLAQEPGPTIDDRAAAHAEGLSAAFRQATEIVQPTVVSITSEKEFRLRGSLYGDLPQIPDEFRRFFGDDFERFFNGHLLKGAAFNAALAAE